MEDRPTGDLRGTPSQNHPKEMSWTPRRLGEEKEVTRPNQQAKEVKFSKKGEQEKEKEESKHQDLADDHEPQMSKAAQERHKLSPLKSADNSRKLFFKPLDKHSTKETILSAISKFGKVEYLRVPFSNKKKKNLGYGFVVFESVQVINLLCDHQIKTKIDDKIVGFSRFDVQKYKSKKAILSSCSDSDADPGEDIEVNDSNAPLRCLLDIQGSSIDRRKHFVKPTKSDYFQLGRYPKGVKYKYNLEKLIMKNLRDTRTATTLEKLNSGQFRDL
jgi:RNA recognition motif-containing protein